MITVVQNRRLWALAALLGLAFLGLGFRLVELQVLRHEPLAEQAHDNTQRTYYFQPRRGDIRDARGRLLATSVPVKTVCADPALIRNRDGDCQAEVAHALAPLLDVSETELVKRIQLRPVLNEQGQVLLNDNKQPLTNRYVVLKHKVRIDQWQQITQTVAALSTQLMAKALSQVPRKLTRLELRAVTNYYASLKRSAIFSEDDQLRVYPNRNLGAHVLGHVASEERKSNGHWMRETVGRDGVELTLHTALRGTPGWRRTETDRQGSELVSHREEDVAPRSGVNAILTLDARIQEIVESELAVALQKHSPISASAMVVQPSTGAILAMATLPNFDPNCPGASPTECLRNRAISDLAEPGSTFKIVVVAGALNEKTVDLGEAFDCENGRFFFGGRILRDHERYGMLTVEQIITKSSNIGAAKIGIKMGPELLYAYMRSFGFGDRTGIRLPGERLGTVHALKQWNKLSISRIPMGHEVAVTPLQMNMAMSAIANGGRLMRPMIIDHLEDDQGRTVMKDQPKVVRVVCSESTALQMVLALKSVVSTNGTAYKAHLENYTVAGKTGTAQKANAVGYLPDKYFSSFIGFFPADRPELCISVVLDEPQHGYYGGQVVAPVFRAIAERTANYLGLRPDVVGGEVLAANHAPRQLTNEPTD